VRAAATAALLAALALAAPAAGATGPGCAADRPAVAHRAGARVLSAQPAGAPIPCLTRAGPTTDSAPVATTPSGTVLFAPIAGAEAARTPAPADLAFPTLVARTTDDGAHYDTVLPVGDASDPARQHYGLIPWLTADPATGRAWYATPTSTTCGATLSHSDDDGRTWTDDGDVGCPGQGGMSVFEGPAPAGSPQPKGYPHVVYYCANLQDNGPHLMYCYRSLDGGRSFAQVGAFPNTPSPPPSCHESLDAPRGRAVAPDGALVFVVDRCDEGLALATSHDEGDSFSSSPITTAPTTRMPITSLAVDARGALYVAFSKAGDGLPYLTASRDRGGHWTEPAMIAAPGVTQVDPRTLAVGARGDGQVAIAYSGSRDGGATWDGYLAEADAGLDADARWWSATVNDPAHPLLRGAPSSLYGDREWFSSVAFGPDGSAWAGFHCVRTELCPDERAGMVGRLAPTGAAGAPASCAWRVAVRRPHRRGRRFVSVKVSVDGKRRAGRRGRDVRRVVLHGLAPGPHRLRIVARTAGGRRVRITRTVTACVP
jgi:hypothetical protein